MNELKKACSCPTCKVPVQVKGLHKNLTFSTLVACTSKLKDILEDKRAEEKTRAILNDEADDMETQMNEPLVRKTSPASLEALNSIADLSDTDEEQIAEQENLQPSSANKDHMIENLKKNKAKATSAIDPIKEPATKRLAKRTGKVTPKVTPQAEEKTVPRMKTPTSSTAKKPRKSLPETTVATLNSEQTETDLLSKEPLKILLSGLNSDDKALVTEYCKEVQKGVKVQIASDYDPKTVNRIIMNVNDAGLCTRTTKYLRGILDGKVIVSLPWFFDSLSKKQWLLPDNYLVKGDTSIGKATDAVKLSLGKNSDSRLFSEFTFYVCGRFGTPSKQDLTALLKAGGAKVVTVRPKADLIEENHVVLYDPDMLDDASLWIMTFDRRTSSQWVLDCISSYQILPLY